MKNEEISTNEKEEIYIKAGVRIERLRNAAGYNRKQFAGKINVSDKFLYEIERGKRGFSALILWNIANCLGVSCDYILTGKRNTMTGAEFANVLERFSDKDMKKIIRILKIVLELKK